MQLESKVGDRTKVVGYGGIAVIAWSLSAYIVCLSRNIALFEFLSITQLIGGGLGLFIERKILNLKDVTKHFKTDWPFVLLLLGNLIAYPYAFRNAPAAHVDLITYLWPTMLVVGEVIRTKKPLKKRQVFGTIICLIALVILIYPGFSEIALHKRYILGYFAGFVAALSWTVYNLLGKHFFRKYHKSTAIDILYTGIICAIIHTFVGKWSMPNPVNLGVMMVLGVFVYGIAFPCWNRALQMGHHTLVAGMASAIPIFSIFWLIIGGISKLSYNLVVAFVLVTIGCFYLGKPERDLTEVQQKKV